jgi:putative nucleotidyltransferase with HDIG domain
MTVTAAPTHVDPSKTRRIELILRQIESLPTLPAVATRLLQLTASDDSHARQVIEAVKSDQALTSKILSMCHKADLGVRTDTLTIDKAVLLLGFNAIRNAVLSLKVWEIFTKARKTGAELEDGDDKTDTRPGQTGDRLSAGSAGTLSGGASGDGPRFDRAGFWRHCLAVAVTAELIAEAHPEMKEELPPAEAFVCGLLHDIGKLALDYVLPKSFDRVAELVEINQTNIADFERRIIGIDHHTAGKRVAEQWQLPHRLQDCIWLHGSAYEMLPTLEHKRLVGLISLADVIVRRQHLGYSGNFLFKQDPDALARQIGLDPQRVAQATTKIHTELERREEMLGLADRPSHELFLESIQQANQMLGRLNAALERRSRAASRQAQVLDAITTFNAAGAPGRSVQDVMAAVVASASAVFGQGFFAIIYQPKESEPWLICRFDDHGRVAHSQIIDPPTGAPDLVSIDANHPTSFSVMSILPSISDFLIEAEDMRNLRLLPLGCGWGTSGLLVHDRPVLPPWQQLTALTTTWGAAIAAASQHEGAKRIGEELAEANRALAETQDKLLQSESMVRLGEMAAGAAHEMNNPLTVISGRSQMLANLLETGSEEMKLAKAIHEQSHRLSDLITSLRLYADPPKPQTEAIDVGALLNATVNKLLEERPDIKTPIYVQLKHDLSVAHVDPAMIGQAVTELIHNAIQAQPKTSVQVTARENPPENTLLIQVADDGAGMDSYVLSHALDPFFSAKPAGRRVGMGLPRAQQLVAAHQGQVSLRSMPDEGTVATLVIPLDSSL